MTTEQGDAIIARLDRLLRMVEALVGIVAEHVEPGPEPEPEQDVPRYLNG